MCGSHQKSISPWASPIVVVPKKSAPGEPPRWRMCINFRKINELQSKTQRVDKQTNTQVNLSLNPLTKIDKMYANLCGARIFTTLDLRSGYYHIGLDKESKAKTAFVTPFGKYEFNAVNCFSEIKGSRTQAQRVHAWFLQKRNTLLRTFNLSWQNITIAWKIG